MSKIRVFVYGTLKASEPNHYLMTKEAFGSCVFKGNAVTVQKYPLVVASRYNVPYMLGAEGKGHNVQGEVYEVDDAQLARLDQLEQHPKLYERKDINVKMLSGDLKDSIISIMAYVLVKYQQHLLDLPMLESYKDGVNERHYVGPKERDASSMPAPLWWYEVHTEYTEPN